MKTKRENVVSKKTVLKKALKTKEKKFTPKAGASLTKAVKNVQAILKKKKVETPIKKTSIIKPSKPSFKPIKEKREKNRGIVYVGHIPHGFYEEQMKDYFGQFGQVTRVRVARSKKTGISRGYGYVEFLYSDIAKIAAQTMNNYLMCGRLLKATYIPPEKQHSGYFLGSDWSEQKYPRLKNREKATKRRNKVQSAEDYKNYVKSSLDKLSVLENKLQRKGISIKFQPVDVPST